MAGSGPPNDADGYSYGDPRFGDNGDELFTEEPSPWYLKPWVLALWGVAVVALIAAIIWGLVELASGNGNGPASTPPSTTRQSSTTKPSPTTTTTPTTTSETTTTSVPPESSAPPLPPTTNQTWTQRPRRHWWNGNLPNMPNVPNLPHIPGHNP
ncbi:MAG: hypothetical protein J2P17_25490 [Mycobacterium sp.]|nr:hypothetical protein [Mycobacterium sp.]